MPSSTTTVIRTVTPRCGGRPPAIRVTTVASAETRSTSRISAPNAPRRNRRPDAGPNPPRPTHGGGPSPHGGRCCSGIGEPVSHAVHGQDVARSPRLGLDLAPEVLHV